MADYKQDGNRWTAVYLVTREHGDTLTYRKLPWELVRFNVDVTPDAQQAIVPSGIDGPNTDADKVYEKIWIVDSLPYAGKTSFGIQE